MKNKQLCAKTKKAHKMDVLEVNRRENGACSVEWKYGDEDCRTGAFQSTRSVYMRYTRGY